MDDRRTTQDAPACDGPTGAQPPPTPRTRRTVNAGAVALAATVLVTGMAAIAHRVAAPEPVSLSAQTGPQSPGDGGSPGPGSNGWSGSAGRTPRDTRDATAAQERGMVLVHAVVHFGADGSSGTGLVLGHRGLVVTSHHVVVGATSVRVTVAATGRAYTAEVVGTDATHDVALLRLPRAAGLATVVTDTARLAPGAVVTTVGDAGGDGGSLTAAPGSVTADRAKLTVRRADGTDAHLADLVEVDADVVPGDSGGAILDAEGEVVAMTAAAAGEPARRRGYAVPIARVLRITEAILAGRETGTVSVGYDGFLGVTLRRTDLPTVAAVVPGTAAAALGLRSGDLLTAVGGVAVRTASVLQATLADRDPGDRVRIAWTDLAGRHHVGRAALTRAPVR